MQECPGEAAWLRLLHDEVGEPELVSLEQHLDNCPACRDRLSRLADTSHSPSVSLRPTPSLDRLGYGARADRFPEIPGYRAVAEVGRGGMGVVYRAWQMGAHQPVALKVLSAGNRLSPDAQARLVREAQTLAKLNHPGIVRQLDFGESNGQPYLAMEWVEGGDLSARLRRGPMRPRDAAVIARALALAVSAAHEHGIIHRDIKPSNVLIGPDGSPRLTDFGLAREQDGASVLTSDVQALGTPAYMPPEQVDAHFGPVGPRADVYSLGATLYEMLTGLPPFRSGNPVSLLRQVTSREPVPPRLLEASIPVDLEAICRKCLAKHSARRYPSAEALAEDLSRALDGRRTHAEGRTPIARAGRVLKRRAGILAAALMVLATAGAMVSVEHYRRTRAEDQALASRRRFSMGLDEIDRMFVDARSAALRGVSGGFANYEYLCRYLGPVYERVLPLDHPEGEWTTDEIRRLEYLASIHFFKHHEEQSTPLYQRCATLGELRLESRPDDRWLALAVVNAECQLSIAAARLGDQDGLRTHDERAYRIARGLGLEILDLPDGFFTRARAQSSMWTYYLGMGRPVDAERVSWESLSFYKRALDARPDNREFDLYVADELSRLATALVAQNHNEEGCALIDEAQKRLDRLSSANPPPPGLSGAQSRLSQLMSGRSDLVGRR